MNQSIRPLPFAPFSEKEVAAAALVLPPANSADQPGASDFGDLLDSEFEDQSSAPQKKQSEADPWTILGIAQLVLPVTEPLPADLSALVERAAGELDSAQLINPEVLPAVTQEIDLDQSTAPNNTSGEAAAEPQNQPRPLLELLKLAQQNLPTQVPPQTLQTEQIAGNPLVSAKLSNGIPAAQVPPMLLASQKQEETAPRQGIALSEESFDASSSEPAIQALANKSQRDLAPKQDFDLAEFVTNELVEREWSSFDGISETSDLQAPKRAESVEVAQAIRTHVELLRTSNQAKIDVVLRPDGQTELRLQVEKVNGQVIVQARCDRGDFARLDAHWIAVQQTLAIQGVRVEALQNGASFQNEQRHWNNEPGSSGQHQSSFRERELNFIEQERPVPTRPKQSVAINRSARGWQSWA